MEGEVVTMQEIFRLNRHGIDPSGTVRTSITATGIRPRFADRLRESGIEIPPEIFEPGAVI